LDDLQAVAPVYLLGRGDIKALPIIRGLYREPGIVPGEV
jgi:hypothetical protein